MSRLTLNNDFAPTFADIAGGTAPDFVDGRSMLPVLRGDPTPWRTAVMNERPINAGHSITPYHAIITERQAAIGRESPLYDLSVVPRAPFGGHSPSITVW